MKRFFKILAYIIAIIVALVLLAVGYLWFMHEPNWHVEKNAVRSESHPLAGFWKGENCNDDFGWAIGPAGEGLYYISFCGPGGCFAEGTYRENTTIINDPKYNVVGENTIKFLSQGSWSTHVRCPGRT
jgi:hypothetical protein